MVLEMYNIEIVSAETVGEMAEYFGKAFSMIGIFSSLVAISFALV